jgi:hypothetical protein
VKTAHAASKYGRFKFTTLLLLDLLEGHVRGTIGFGAVLLVEARPAFCGIVLG